MRCSFESSNRIYAALRRLENRSASEVVSTCPGAIVTARFSVDCAGFGLAQAPSGITLYKLAVHRDHVQAILTKL